MISSVPFVALHRQYEKMRHEIDTAVKKVLLEGLYVGGPEVYEFEEALAEICGSKYCLTVANGTDALVIAMKILGIGVSDQVIVPVNSFIASAGSVIQVGAEPIFCDVLENFNIDFDDAERKITDRTKAIMPVHLTGNPADMHSIRKLAEKYNLFVIEDAAQAVGASFHGMKVGSMGDLAAFSLHPLKNLFVPGDGGFLTMQCSFLYNRIKAMRNHGLINRDTCASWGVNSRLDTIHCAIGLEKVKVFDEITARFLDIATKYRDALSEVVVVPEEIEGVKAVYHNFVIKCERRDELAEYLRNNGVETKMHYPILLHQQPASANLHGNESEYPVAERLNKLQLSLPIFPEMSDDEVNFVIHKIVSFYND